MRWAVPVCLFAALSLSACDHARSLGPEPPDSGTAAVAFAASPNEVKVAGALNTRRVDSLRTRDGRHLRSGVLYRSGHFVNVNEEGQADLVKLGIVSVFDLRSEKEVTAAPDPPWIIAGMRHMVVSLPEPGPSDRLSCARALDAAEPKLHEVFAHLGSPKSLPAVFHCGLGRGRACLCMAIVLLSLGVPDDVVAEDFRKNQTSPVEPHWLDALFARVRAKGGIDAYLTAHAVARADLESFRSQALE